MTHHTQRIHVLHAYAKSAFWFLIGASLGLIFFISFLLFFFQNKYNNIVYPGVSINGTDFGGKTLNDVRTYFAKKNAAIAATEFVFQDDFAHNATISAKTLNLGYDENLLADQAYSVGRAGGILSDFTLITQAYLKGVDLSPAYHYDDAVLALELAPIVKAIRVEPEDALFAFENNRVTTFKPSHDGQEVDMMALKERVNEKTRLITMSQAPSVVSIAFPIRILKPKITTETVNSFGIKELIGTGTSLFQGSIENRVYNVTLASSRLNGVLVAPNENFSFNKKLGDVSAFTGYKQAYVIQNGRTVLGDGGGVCQVSTTLFRALLNAGLPITERHAHDYRVHYYEEDIGPGVDATVYAPSVDLKFKNDTGHYILIQTTIDPSILQLTFSLYGTSDGRVATVDKPIITSTSPAPPTLYQDDPTLPVGVMKQVDFSAPGASVYFTRQVEKNGQVILSETYKSNYRPWQAIFLKGTKT